MTWMPNLALLRAPLPCVGAEGDAAVDVILGKPFLSWREARAADIVTVGRSRDRHNTSFFFACLVRLSESRK